MRIGDLHLSNNLFLAPLAGYTDQAFRVVVKRHGAGMVFTEMVSARGLVYENAATRRYLRTTQEEEPISIQLFGAEPEMMAEAARIAAAEGFAAVDINMGCSVRKVVKGGAGAVLLQDVSRAEKILTAVRKAISLPLTVKLRSGWDPQSINCVEVARMAEFCGVNAVTLHPRTARQLFTGSADWSKIRDVKQSVRVPVIGNGDVKTYADVLRMEAETGCDGVMIGRAALGNPWIFEEVTAARRGCCPLPPTHRMRLCIILTHIDLLGELYEESVGINRFKAHIMHYLKGIRGVKALRRCICSDVHTIDDLRAGIRAFFDTVNATGFRSAESAECSDSRSFSAS